MKFIYLSHGLYTKVDDEDYEKFGKFKWSIHQSGNRLYVKRNNWQKKEYPFLHREIMRAKKGEQIDHINGNTLDNRRVNLRKCKPKENCRNQELRSNNTSGYKGVCKTKNKKKWRAYIVKDYKQFSLGVFTNKLSAAKAYNKAAKKLHGKFAKLNIITD